VSGTNQESNPWWQVDTGSSKDIKKVVVKKRQDCCGDRLTNYQIHVGNNANVWANPACPGLFAGDQTIACELSGRYVGVTIPGDGNTLELCEVEAYTTGVNQILAVSATESS